MSDNRSNSFERAVSTIRSAARRKATSAGKVSAVDLQNIATSTRNSRRGAAVREAFRQLEDEKVLRRTRETVYNNSTRHRVAVYAAC